MTVSKREAVEEEGRERAGAWNQHGKELPMTDRTTQRTNGQGKKVKNSTTI